MRRLARSALAALLAASFAAPVYASPPPVMAPVAVRSTATVAPIAAPTPWIVSAPTPGPGWTQPTPAPTATPTAAPTPAAPTVADAKAYALQQLGKRGYDCLNDIVMHESRWNPLASNPGGAYGIPQALPGSKMASAGTDWQRNPVTQVRWMIGYVAHKYGSACNAARWRAAHGWY